jgi:hypothetical protein
MAAAACKRADAGAKCGAATHHCPGIHIASFIAETLSHSAIEDQARGHSGNGANHRAEGAAFSQPVDSGDAFPGDACVSRGLDGDSRVGKAGEAARNAGPIGLHDFDFVTLFQAAEIVPISIGGGERRHKKEGRHESEKEFHL